MIVCERDTCANMDRRDALGTLAIPSSEDFVANILHLKCKVVQLARRQMQKEIASWREWTMNAELRRIVEPSGTGLAQVPTEEVGTETDRPEEMVPEAADHADEVRPEAIHSDEVAEGIRSVRTSVNDATEPTSGVVETQTFGHWMKKLLANFPFCWIILVVGILGLTSLVCGVLLGAFVCTHGSHSLPAFFRSNARIGRAVY